VKVFGSAMLKELETQKAKQIAAYSAELADTADLTKRARDVEGATAERERVETKAAEYAGQRRVTPADVTAQTDASAIALEEADRAGTLPPGVKATGLMGLSQYASERAVPDTVITDRDRMRAQGKFSEADQAASRDRTAERADARGDRADERGDRTLDLQERREQRLEEFEKIKIDWEKAKGERAETTEQRAATSKALEGTNQLIREIRTDLGSQMLDPKVAEGMRADLQRLTRQSEAYAAALGGVGVKGGEVPKAEKPPATYDMVKAYAKKNNISEEVASKKFEDSGYTISGRSTPKAEKPAAAVEKPATPAEKPAAPAEKPAGEYELIGPAPRGAGYIIKPRNKDGIIFRETVTSAEAKRLGLI
jgi:hypothetical protein